MNHKAVHSSSRSKPLVAGGLGILTAMTMTVLLTALEATMIHGGSLSPEPGGYVNIIIWFLGSLAGALIAVRKSGREPLGLALGTATAYGVLLFLLGSASDQRNGVFTAASSILAGALVAFWMRKKPESGRKRKRLSR